MRKKPHHMGRNKGGDHRRYGADGLPTEPLKRNFMLMFIGLLQLNNKLTADAGGWADIRDRVAALCAKVKSEMRTSLYVGVLALELSESAREVAKAVGWPSREHEDAVDEIEIAARAFIEVAFDDSPKRAKAFIDGILSSRRGAAVEEERR
jgi:hypothetical protein